MESTDYPCERKLFSIAPRPAAMMKIATGGDDENHGRHAMAHGIMRIHGNGMAGA